MFPGTIWSATSCRLSGIGTLEGRAQAQLSPTLGVRGYIFPLAILTSSYGLLQAANNAAVMNGALAGQRGLVSGLLNLSRNLGLITGTSAMGALFVLPSGSSELVAASPEGVSTALRITFAVAAAASLVAVVLPIARRSGADPV